MTEEIGKAFYQTNGAHLMNFCTDRDSTRRQVYNSPMKYEVPIDSNVGKIIHKLPFVDSLAGKNIETVSYDPKHIAKRSWTSQISRKMEIKDTNISKKDLVEMLALSSTIVHSPDALVYPKDKQNVYQVMIKTLNAASNL